MQSIQTTRKTSAGVTLVELLIAVAIVGILAAIAYPSYQAQVRRGNRTDAKAELLEAAQELEKCYTRFGAYNNGGCVAFTTTNTGRLSEKGKYRITFLGAVAPNTYRMQAVLQPGRGTDPECQVFTLDESGQRGVRNGGADVTDAAQIQRCW